METGVISKEIKDTILPVIKKVDRTIKETLESQIAIKEKVEQLMSDLQKNDVEQEPLDQTLVRCVIARKRILNVQRKLAGIHLRLQKLN
jgi:hypothetical protein